MKDLNESVIRKELVSKEELKKFIYEHVPFPMVQELCLAKYDKSRLDNLFDICMEIMSELENLENELEIKQKMKLNRKLKKKGFRWWLSRL